MAERKVFLGARVKRLRQRLGISQAQMAAELGVSPSYLNLIERDQRPLTVQVLLKLSSVYGVDAAGLSGEDAGLLEMLKEVFADPLLQGEVASAAELAEMAEAAPNASRGVARLHAAWREALERLSDLSRSMRGADVPSDRTARLSGARDPAFDEASPWIPELEAAAEALAEKLAPRDDPAQALKAHLKAAYGVETRILPRHVMAVEQARYDRHSQRLFISEHVPLIERPFLMARQLALLGHGELLDRLTAAADPADAEAARLVRLALARRLAAATLAPAERLATAARELGTDPTRLSERFSLAPIRIMLRLATLGAGFPGFPPAFLILIDASGGVLARQAGAGFPFPRFGPLCGRLPLFDPPRPGEPIRAELALSEGGRFVAIAAAEQGEHRPDLPSPRRVAMLGWSRGEAGDLAKDWPQLTARPIGVACRLCEREDCAHRIQPPVTRPAAFQDFVVGPARIY